MIVYPIYLATAIWNLLGGGAGGLRALFMGYFASPAPSACAYNHPGFQFQGKGIGGGLPGCGPCGAHPYPDHIPLPKPTTIPHAQDVFHTAWHTIIWVRGCCLPIGMAVNLKGGGVTPTRPRLGCTQPRLYPPRPPSPPRFFLRGDGTFCYFKRPVNTEKGIKCNFVWPIRR